MEEVNTQKKPRLGALNRPRLSRKRYAESTRFLKAIIKSVTGKSDAMSVGRGMRACELLLDIYDRFDAALERHERAEARAKAQDTAQTSEPAEPEETETADEKIERLLSQYRKGQ